MLNQEEQNHELPDFHAGYNGSQFERPSVSVDVAMLSVEQGVLRVLVARRKEQAFSGFWALPGGFIHMDESLDEAAQRVLRAEAGLSGMYLEQLYTFGDPARDIRTRVITVAYYALVDWDRLESLDTGENTLMASIEVPWEGETGGPVDLMGPEGALPVAFDHANILGMAVKRIRGKLDYVPIGFQLLPPRFTLRQLQEIHETVLNRPLNKDSFRRRMLASGLLEATGEREQDVEHRPAELYRFSRRSAI
jgi:8-oxo-dGTP diphosphatase